MFTTISYIFESKSVYLVKVVEVYVQTINTRGACVIWLLLFSNTTPLLVSVHHLTGKIRNTKPENLITEAVKQFCGGLAKQWFGS